MSSILSTPGTPTERPPTTASRQARGLPCASRKRSGVAAAGAVSRPSNATTCAPSWSKSKAPPPMPEDCGSVNPSTNCAAIAASTAEPPCCKIEQPAAVARGLAVAIIARLARTTAFSVKPVALSGALSELPAIDGTSIARGSLSALKKGRDTNLGCQVSYALRTNNGVLRTALNATELLDGLDVVC